MGIVVFGALATITAWFGKPTDNRANFPKRLKRTGRVVILFLFTAAGLTGRSAYNSTTSQSKRDSAITQLQDTIGMINRVLSKYNLSVSGDSLNSTNKELLRFLKNSPKYRDSYFGLAAQTSPIFRINSTDDTIFYEIGFKNYGTNAVRISVQAICTKRGGEYLVAKNAKNNFFKKNIYSTEVPPGGLYVDGGYVTNNMEKLDFDSVLIYTNISYIDLITKKENHVPPEVRIYDKKTGITSVVNTNELLGEMAKLFRNY